MDGERTGAPRALLAGLAGLLACCCAGSGDEPSAPQPGASQAAKQLARDLAALEAARDRLAAQLDRRRGADRAVESPADFHLRLDEGADGEELHLVLRRRGGKWPSAHAVVPAWRQEAIQEKFVFHHHRGATAAGA